MNARTIRRAIERKAQKEARKAHDQAPQEAAVKVMAATPGSFAGEEQVHDEEEQTAVSERTISDRQLGANRRNAALSTGPTSPEGKARSSRNALKTGLTGKTVLLTSEDAALYEHHVTSFFEELNPIGDRESELVQSIADSKWRLGRIPSLEFGIYALGRIEFAAEFQNLPKAEAASLIEVKTFMAYQKQLNNLSIQECRLRRQCEKDTAELTRLQALRAEAERTAARKAMPNTAHPLPRRQQNGFEFSHPSLESVPDSLTLHADLLQLPQTA